MNLYKYDIYYKYIRELVKNQNDTNSPLLQDIYSTKDYERLLKPVLKAIRENRHAHLSDLRLQLYKESGLIDITNNFVKKTMITPGLIIDFGTYKNRDTIVCGLQQEWVMKDGILVKDELPIEQDTIFDLASTSKTFTAVAILKLYDEGTIDIFDSVVKYVPECKNLGNTTIYDLLKFRVKIVTDVRVDSAKNKEEAERILFTVHPIDNQSYTNAYTDMGAMILRYIIERTTKMPMSKYLEEEIFKKLEMKDTYLRVPDDKIKRVANENYSTIITKDGTALTKYDNIPGTPHDNKAIAIGQLEGITPGHAGFFSTKDDMLRFAKGLIEGEILSKDSLLSMSETETGYKGENGYTWFYGSLVYLKQPDPKNLSVYPPLSGRTFMSPGFAGTTLVVDPLNKLTLFVGGPRLHNRIYQIHPEQIKNIKVDKNNKKTFLLPNGEEKIVCIDYTKSKEVLVRLALDLAIQYQLLEKIYPRKKEMHLVREL